MSIARFSVQNEVLVNVLMWVILAAGSAFALILVREMFPESRPDQISITAFYTAVQPDELEKAVTIKIEEAIRDIEGVEKVESRVFEGNTTTTATLFNEVSDVDSVFQEIKNEVDAIEDLPDDLERYIIRKVEPTLPVMNVALFGNGSEAALKQAARDLRDEMLQLPDVTKVDITGVKDDEISVEIKPLELLRYDISFAEVARAIRGTNLDVSGGTLKGERNNVSVRTLGEELNGEDLLDIVVKTFTDGRQILLADIATVSDGFVDVDIESYFNGKPAVNLIVQKTKDQDAIQIANEVKAFIAGKQGIPYDPYGFAAVGELPRWQRPLAWIQCGLGKAVDVVTGRPDLSQIYEQSRAKPFAHAFEIQGYSDLSRFIRGRLDLMVRNGQSGLVLVLISLVLFLNWRVAFWAAVGLPVSFMGTFVIMWLLGVSINLLSMFGLIIVLGILVDDAIVVGENVYRHVEEGMSGHDAAIHGTNEVMWPVIVAVGTTIAAFMPLLFIRGQIGDFFRELPIVVGASLSVSLLEALVILPAHLCHLPPVRRRDPHTAQPWWHRLRAAQEAFVHQFLGGIYERILRVVLTWRYVTVAAAIGGVLISMGLLASGIVKDEFIQQMDSETLIADLEMPVGTIVNETRDRLLQATEFALSLPEVTSVQSQVGIQMALGGSGAMAGTQQSHIGQLIIELKEADQREREGLRSSEILLNRLREYSAGLTGINSLKWEAFSGGPAGKDIEIRVSGARFEDTVTVATRLRQELATFEGVVDLDDNYDLGKRELRLAVRDSARPTGINVDDLGNFVRAALFGVEARRITRNRESVKIMVRYPESRRADVHAIEAMWMPTPDVAPGASQSRWVPVGEVAQFTETQGYTTIYRAAQDRSLTIYGDVDSTRGNLADVMQKLTSDTMTSLQAEFPNTRIELLGTSEERGKSFAGLALAFPVALLLIYLMLTGLFRSYWQPAVVMTAIPFGIAGTLVGHWMTDNPFTILSRIGLVALSGIVVNDSLVLVDFINSLIRKGLDPFTASVQGAKLRLRAILLTTVTTVAGLTPLMFETSFQAKFLIPMAVTLTYGLAFATILTLIVVPCLNLIYLDIAHRRTPGGASHADVEAAERTPAANHV